MSGYREHITAEGDRWDLLAWKYYGDAAAYEGIIAANPTVPIFPVLPAGVRLLVPVLDPPAPALVTGLPEWRIDG